MSAGGEDKVKKARGEWEKAGPTFQKFLTEMAGGVQGNLSQQIQDASAREADFEDKHGRRGTLPRSTPHAPDCRAFRTSKKFCFRPRSKRRWTR